MARERGAWVVFGGIHATLFPDEAREHGGAHAVVRGDGDLIWPQVVARLLRRRARCRCYEGGRIGGDQFVSARWDLLPEGRYMWASVQTVRGCPKHCSFCSVWRTDGQEPRQRGVDRVVREVVELRRLGFRFIALADDNFYPVTFEDLGAGAAPRGPVAAARARGAARGALRADGAAGRAAGRSRVLHADHHGGGRGSGVPRRDEAGAASAARWSASSRSPRDGLKDVYKGFNLSGDELVARLRAFRRARRPRARLVHLRAAERREQTPSTRRSRWRSRPT